MVCVDASRWTRIDETPGAVKAGLRFGDRGTQSSRTIMLTELTDLLAAVPASASRADYVSAIVQDNTVGKSTVSNRRLTYRRLHELYGLDPALPIFRVLRRLWDVDVPSRPLLALLCALGRDPLLRLTAPTVLALRPGEELVRATLLATLGEGVRERFKAEILDKVARNAASSWTQAGHLAGRMRKTRVLVEPRPGAVAFALWLGSANGRSGGDLLIAPWVQIFDCGQDTLVGVVLKAKQLRLLDARIAGNIVEIHAVGVDPGMGALGR